MAFMYACIAACCCLPIAVCMYVCVSVCAPILHGASLEVGDGEQVELRQWIWDVEVLVIEVQYARSHIQREHALLLLAQRREAANQHAIRRRLQHVELTYDER